MHASTRQPAVSLKICEYSVRASAVASVSYIDPILNSMWSTCMLRTWKKPMAGPAPDSARGLVYLQFLDCAMPRMAQRDWLMYTDVGCTQWTSTRCRTPRKNQSAPQKPQPQPPHTRVGSSSPPFIRKTHKVSCPAFHPNTSPCNIHAASTMRFVASRG